MLQRISDYAPDYIIGEITTSTCGHDYETLAAIRSRFPQIKLLLGGTHATALPDQVLDVCPAVDVILRAEYEHTVVEIASGIPLENIKGITYRKESVSHSNPDRSYCENLDELPFVSKVYKQFLNSNDYMYAFAQKPMIQIFTARGCPHRCNFCSYPETMGGRAFRKRSVDNVVDEIEYITKEMPEIKEIFFEDDTFTVDKKRVAEICDEIIRRDLKVTWSCNTRADIGLDLMKKMKASGCRLVVVGYESGNADVLKQIQKGVTLDQSIAFAQNTKKAGIKVFGCFMIGLTGDTPETIQDTYRFAKKCKPDMCFFQQAVPFPRTRFYDWAKSNGYLITEDYTQWLNQAGTLRCLVHYPWAVPAEVEKIRDNLMSRYYFNPVYMVTTVLKSLTSRAEFIRVMRGGLNYIGFRLRKSGGSQ
jgi:radical SAM superfamily enzyme YgiQ (UPF0313 family)